MKEISIFKGCPLSKAEQKELADQLIAPILEGEADPIATIIKARSLVESLTAVLSDDQVKDVVLREVEKYGKEASWNDVRITAKELGVKYDYSHCNDPVYNDLVYRKKALDSAVKEREEFLKKIPYGMTIVDDRTGEVVTLSPAVRMASSGYAITFKKG